MFKLQVNLWKESEWKDVSYAPTNFRIAKARYEQYVKVWGNVHNYRIQGI